MEKIRKIFRNPASDLLLMVGLVISCIILLNIADLASKITVEENAKKGYTYTSSIAVSGEMVNEDIDYISKYVMDYLDKVETGNLYIVGYVNIDEYKGGGCSAHFLMEKNEDLQFTLKDGYYNDDENYENAVIIGESLEEAVVEKEGKKYIIIEDKCFNVIGILENTMSAGIDSSLYIFWDSLTAEAKDEWLSRAFYEVFNRIYFESNISEPLFLTDLRKNMSEYGLYFEELQEEVESKDEQLNETYKLIRIALLAVSLIISVLICFGVSYLWLLNRRQELAIRMSYGYSGYQIYKLLLMDLIKIMVMALVIAVIIQFIGGMISENNILFDDMIFIKLLTVFIGSLVIVLINTWYLMKKMRRFSVVMINEEK